MHGQVVQARQGQRQHYQPIRSQLTSSHHLVDVVAAILQVYAFDCLYIADLNAITGDAALPDHRRLIQAAMQSFPHLHWWVDAGLRTADALKPWLDLGVTPILASESLPDMNTFRQLCARSPHSILSLDFFQDGFRGPQALLATPAEWTQPAIVMSLPKVGANLGPDVQKMAALKQAAPEQRIYAAGGVRHKHDIRALEQAGADGVLVASALHTQQLVAADFRPD